MATLVDTLYDDDVFRLLIGNDTTIAPLDSDLAAFAAGMMPSGEGQLSLPMVMDTEMTLAAAEQRQPPTSPLSSESEYYSSSATSPKSPCSPSSTTPLGSPQIAVETAYSPPGLPIFQVGDPLPALLTDPGDPAKPIRRRKHIVPTAVTLPEEQLLKISSQELEEFARRIAMTRKLTPEEKKELRRQRRLVKNREYATMSRAKKKTQIQQLEQKLSSLESENAELRTRNTALETELAALKTSGASSSPQLCSRCGMELMEAGKAGTNPLASSWFSIGTGMRMTTSHASSPLVGARAAQGVALCIVLFSFAFYFMLPGSPHKDPLAYNTGRVPLSAAEADSGGWWGWSWPWSTRPVAAHDARGERPPDRNEKNDTSTETTDTVSSDEAPASTARHATVTHEDTPPAATCVFDLAATQLPAGLVSELLGMPSCGIEVGASSPTVKQES